MRTEGVKGLHWRLITFRALLHLGPNVITFRTLLHLGPNVITFRTLLHLEQLLHLGLQQQLCLVIQEFTKIPVILPFLAICTSE